jgi:hypothetical protein
MIRESNLGMICECRIYFFAVIGELECEERFG